MSAADALAALAAAYPDRQIGPDTIAVYLAALDDLPDAEVEQAVAALIRTAHWPPSIAQIRERVAEERLALPTPAAALAQVELHVFRRGGAPHPDVAEALRIVGGARAWRESDRPSVLRGQFLAAYADLRATAVREVQQGPPRLALPGRTLGLLPPSDGIR